jgi:2,5-diketo-D-gluconate reductase A
VIPKTVNPDRMRENIAIFDFMLDPGEIAAISALNENRGVGSDPRTMTLDFV